MPPSISPSPTTNDLKSLSALLNRLTPKILSTNPHSSLRYSPYERSKTLANLEYARTLLLRSEHTASLLKIQSKKHALQETLVQHRAAIKRLSDRLFELGQLDDGRFGSGDDSDGDGEVDEILRAVIEDDIPPSPVVVRAEEPRTLGSARAELLGAKGDGAGLRARGAARVPALPDGRGSTTGHSVSSGGQGEKSSTQTLESAETLHGDITSSLVDLAMQLKRSAQAFSDDLAADDQQLGSTEEALGKNKSGLDTATQRMGVLRKMSEGRWWWGRMALYAGIAGLWVVLILFVFVGPKIRF